MHFDNWDKFKGKLVDEFGSIEVFRREALKLFTQLDQPLQNVKELTNMLAPRINGLKSSIKCVADFHDHTVLRPGRHHHIYCIPVWVCPTFLPVLEAFKATDISNQMPPAIFNFLSTFISSTAKTYLNYPLDFDDNISVTNIAIKQV